MPSQEIGLEERELVVGLFFFLEGFADGLAEERFNLALRAYDRHRFVIDEAGNLAHRLLLEHKRLYNHSNFSFRFHKFSDFFVTLTLVLKILYGRA